MTIVAKDIILDLLKHMATSQNATCHNLYIYIYIYVFLSNQILPRASLLT